jgi:hypothetical protein
MLKKWWDNLCFEYRKRTFFIRLEPNCFRICVRYLDDYVHNGLTVRFKYHGTEPTMRVVWQCELVYHRAGDHVLVYKYSDDWAKEFNKAVWEVNHAR